MTSLSDDIGPVTANTPDDLALALIAALRAATNADEASAFRGMLGLGGVA